MLLLAVVLFLFFPTFNGRISVHRNTAENTGATDPSSTHTQKLVQVGRDKKNVWNIDRFGQWNRLVFVSRSSHHAAINAVVLFTFYVVVFF